MCTSARLVCVCVCMYVYIHICMYMIYIHVCTHTHTQIRNKCMQHIHVLIHTYMQSENQRFSPIQEMDRTRETERERKRETCHSTPQGYSLYLSPQVEFLKSQIATKCTTSNALQKTIVQLTFENFYQGTPEYRHINPRCVLLHSHTRTHTCKHTHTHTHTCKRREREREREREIHM